MAYLNEKILGKLFGKIVSAVFVLSNLFISSQVLYYVGNFLTTQILPYTPLTAIRFRPAKIKKIIKST